MMRVLCLCCAAFLWLASEPVQARSDVYLSAYWAKNSPDRLADILSNLEAERRSSYLNALAFSRAWREGRWVRWELEGQLVRHHGMQSHWESNVVLVARWMHFPWDDWLDTRFAFGEGLSYAFEEPPLEPRSDPGEESSARLLNYLLVELEFTTPGNEQWSVFTRVHHRSGVYGLFGDVKGGSNFVGLGFRWKL